VCTSHLDVRVQTIDIENAEEIFAVAPPPGTLRVGRYFTALLLLLAVLYSIVALGSRHTPKLGIDLVGGKRVIFTARTINGKAPSSNSMSQARQILEDRVNGKGVTGATVQVQGGNQLLVLIPGGTDTDVAALGEPAVLNFRGLVAPAAAVSCVTGKAAAAAKSGAATASSTATPSTTPSATSSSATAPAKSNPSSTAKTTKSASNAPNDVTARPLALAPAASKTPVTKTPARKTPAKTPAKTPTTGKTTPKATGTAKATATASPSATVTPSASASASPCVANPFAALTKADPKLTIPTTETAFNALTTAQQSEITTALANYDCSAAQNEADLPNNYYIACDDGTDYGTTVAYLLGKVIVPGHEIDSASAQAPSTSGTGGSTQWTVSLTLKGGGSSAWADWTSKYNTGSSTANNTALQCGATSIPCSDFVGFTLNGEVISAPVTQSAINGGATQISGNFNQSSADSLAKELNYGALPLSFRADDNQSVSATLGSQQLRGAFEAGGIGLVLVIIYSLLYYRGLGLVTIASLIVSAGLTYALLVLLGTQIGFTLDLAGIAGFIVALGITADSFVVFFERIKDEVHEGRSMRVAVPRAWIRARRTVLSADTVSFLAAAILYYFASADVKGFAFTLGLSTILDLVVVFLFTHPIVSVLSRSRAFGSPRFTGLNAVRVGGFDVDEPAPRARRGSAARSASSKPAKAKPTAKPVKQKAPVAVLDDDDVEEFDDESPTVIDDNSINDDGSDFSDETVGTGGALAAHDDELDAQDDDEPRRSTTPEPGSAAERAAARRARLRAEKDEKGER
jgi:preprotein translocase subunit SecD